ncbi:MAG: cytochrome c3 family protein [bacterium]|nr:cytochrome c3 family protein [bacterium]
MKTLLIVQILLFVVMVPAANGFHRDGVAQCGSCHVMHNQEGGVVMLPGGSPQLLNDASASGVCLSCHGEQFGAVLGIDPLVPPPEFGGGKFVFLFEDNINDGPAGADNPIGGYASGHSIIEPSVGLSEDPVNMRAPGGTFRSNKLSCASCHDPHGNQNFQMLYGVGHIKSSNYNFNYPAPIAQSIDIASRRSETQDNHTAYISGMSEWCANCHGFYHDLVGRESLEHEFNLTFEESQISRYNSYSGIQNPDGGDPATSYIVEVPFEDASATINKTSGPTSTSRVMCLTCHRAHGSSSVAAGRWDFRVTSLDYDGVESGSYPIPSPYNGPNEPPLCSKCHSTVPSAPATQE